MVGERGSSGTHIGDKEAQSNDLLNGRVRGKMWDGGGMEGTAGKCWLRLRSAWEKLR